MASAVEQAKAAAGDKAFQMVGGSSIIRQLLATCLVDELHLASMPLLLGDGLRLFEPGVLMDVRLPKPEALVIGARTSLRFRVGL